MELFEFITELPGEQHLGNHHDVAAPAEFAKRRSATNGRKGRDLTLPVDWDKVGNFVQALTEWLGSDCPDDDGFYWALITGTFYRGKAAAIPASG